ncbi:MAG: hypothetical protein KDA51_08650, partial [Planctomycetales bacterium]|nr:hypothetical protein [Planctomycetales bacterium]MCA9181510.1 hypothetical protein [Planctomycetales bacterium]
MNPTFQQPMGGSLNRPTPRGKAIVQQLATLTALTVAVGLMLFTTMLSTQAQTESEESNSTPLFNGTDLSGWYGWSTRDPQELWAMSPEEQAEYKRKSVEGGLLNADGKPNNDNINAHWRVENG